MQTRATLDTSAAPPSRGRATKPGARRSPPGQIGALAGIARYVDILRDPLGTLLRGRHDYGDVVRMQIGPQEYWLVSDPEAVRHILVENAKNYVKSPNYVGLKLVLGQGLVTSEGELWKRQRRLASPAFTHKKLEGFVPTFVDAVEDMLDDWQKSGVAELDAHAAMSRLTLTIVGRCLFDVDLGAAATEGHAKAFATVLNFANAYSFAPVKLPIGTPLPSFIAFRRALGELDALVEGIIRERRARVARGESPGNDLLAAFLSARDESGAAMDDGQLRDEVMTMVGAGHETTANALAFTLRLLSQHPDVERRVLAEVLEVAPDRRLCAADLPRLGYTERVIKESMRLLPPVWMVERANLEDDEIAGYHLPKGTVVGISPWVLHRDARWFPNPEGFDPDRWLPEHDAQRPRWVYMPFGAGPRVCIGNGFAMMEATALLGSIVRRARLELVPGGSLALDPNVTLRPKHGVAVRVRMRAPHPAVTTGASVGATEASVVRTAAPVERRVGSAATTADAIAAHAAAAGCPHAAAAMAARKATAEESTRREGRP